MACYAKLYCVLNVFMFYICNVDAKVFSKSLEDFRNFQKPSVRTETDEILGRLKRSALDETKFSKADHVYSHSQNYTLSTTEFSLNGENDNEVFVHWSGAENNVSIFNTLILKLLI